MTREWLLGLTGMRQIGEGDNMYAVGTIHSYPVSAVADKKGRSLTLDFTVTESNVNVKKLSKSILADKGLKGKVSIVNGSVGDSVKPNVFRVVLTPADEAEAQTLYPHIIAQLGEALSTLDNLTPPTVCAICQSENSDTLATYNASLNIVHRNCLEQWAQNIKKEFDDKENNPNTVRGLIGGVLGGVVGAIPAFLALFIFNYFVFILFALIPLGSAFGWRLFGGKFTYLTTVVVIVLSLFLSVFLDLIDSHLGVLNELNELLYLYPLYYYYIQDFIQHYTLGDTISFYYLDFQNFIEYEIIRNVGLSLLGAIIGIAVSWRFITRTDSANLVATQSILDEAVPL